MGEQREQRDDVPSDVGSEPFSALVRFARDLFYRYRLTEPRGFTYVSPSVTALTGYSPDEYLADPDLMLALVDGLPFAEPPLQTERRDHIITVALRRRDGTQIWTEHQIVPILDAAGVTVALEGLARDVTEQKRSDAATEALRVSALRRLQALDINDSVVQGISAAVLALENGDALTGVRALRATLENARTMMGDLLQEQSQGPIGPGDLLRAHPAVVLPMGTVAAPRAVPPIAAEPLRIIIADDTEDIRTILRYAIGARQGFDVVAEASNGAEAVLLSKEHKPDVVLLDLAMPVMDGLQALPKIRAVSPATKIVILSGYGREQVLPEARALEPDGYAEKGMPTDELVALLRGLFPNRPVPTDGPTPPSLEEQLAAGADLEIQLSNYSHELRTPLTVIQGVGATLLERMDLLPSPVVRELLESLNRNARQMGSLLDAFSDARHVGESDLALMHEEVDLALLVRQTVADLAEVTKGHPIEVVAPDRVQAFVDPVRLRQVLANLLSNAAKFSPAESPIDIAVRSGEGTVGVIVADRGSGIPEDRVPRLFGRFERLGAEGRGLGLGLYLSRGIARAHGGTLQLARSDARGSVFALTLPVGIRANAEGRTSA